MSQLLKLQEVADRLRVHQSTVWKLVDKGELKGFRFGGSWRVKEEHLEEYIEEQFKKPVEKPVKKED